MIRAGRLRHVVSVQAKATTQSTSGQPTGAWSEVFEARALVEEIDGSERWAKELNVGELTHNVTMRYRSGVTRAHRVVWGSRVLNIQSMKTDPRKRRMELRCIEVV